MRILQIFNPYVNYGGEESAVNQISLELEKGHELRNVVFDVHGWAGGGLLKRARQFALMVWNPVSVRMVREAIADFKPDVILLHNIMPVGSAALYFHLSRCGIPLVHYIHNFRPFSVNGYCWGGGRILAEGLDLNFLPEILAGSWQESRLKTAWYGLLIRAMHALGVYRRINGWIAISRFMKDTFVKGGIGESRIRVIPHSWEPTQDGATTLPAPDPGAEPMFLFLGRISEEKGLRVLLDAWEIHERSGGRGTLNIAGDGPLAEEVMQRCEALERANYLGFRGGAEKDALLRSCAALIVPSVWWEPLGLVLYEAYDHSKPVLAAASGGILDHVTDGVTGWIHEPGNAGQLAAHIREVSDHPAEASARGANGRERIERRNPDRWIGEFDAFLESVLAGTEPPAEEIPQETPLRAQVYLADQNPGYDRSFGISRMSRMVLGSLQGRGKVRIEAVVSQSSQRGPENVTVTRSLPWGTRSKLVRLLSDHLHPVFIRPETEPDVYYFPKGYLPLLDVLCRPSVVTIHDTIIQYDEDHYPEWRAPWEYGYWAGVLKHTLRNADRIMTVSEFSKRQITAFMERHGILEKEITVTYEPCAYESVPQPFSPEKENKVIHLASIEPHKRTAQLIGWWLEAESEGRDLPDLELIGSVADALLERIEASRTIRLLPFMEDAALQAAYSSARALLPSEIEGFGLPALEAYYLGTPVCFVKGTSVEEILAGATGKGAFSLESRESFFAALDEVMAMEAPEIRRCGLTLRETFDSSKVAERIEAVFRRAAGETPDRRCDLSSDERCKKFAALIRRHVGEPGVLFEFGARDCAETVMIAREFPDARIFPFECNRATLPACREKAAANARIILTESAVGETDGTATFHPIDQEKTVTTWADGNPGASSLFLASGKYEVESYVQRTEEVAITRPDTFMAANGIANVDAVWMDIQGAELMALRGFGERISDVGLISLEAEFVEIYGGQPLFWEIRDFLAVKGFFLTSFLTLGRHSCDAVFVRSARPGFPMRFRSRALLLYAKFMIHVHFPARRLVGLLLRKCGLLKPIEPHGKVIS